MKRKRIITALSLMVVLALSFSACGSGKTSETSPSGTTSTETTAIETTSKPQNVTLRFMWWGGDARHEATLKVIDMFTAQNPHVKIEGEYGGMDGYYQKLVTQLSSGTEPDIMQIVPEWFMTLGSNDNVFLDLGAKSDILDVSGFNQNYINTFCTINGKLQGLPTGMGGIMMAINKNFFSKHNIAPDTKWDWETLKTIGTQVNKQNKDDYLLGSLADGGLNHLVRSYILQQAGTNGWINNDWTIGITEEHLVNAFKYFIDLEKSGVFQPVKEALVYKTPLENNRWTQGQIGMMLSMNSTLGTFATEKVDLGVAPIPLAAGATETGVILGPPQYITISENSKCADEAVAFLNYFYNNKDAILTLENVRGPQPTKEAADVLLEAGKIKDIDFHAINMVSDMASKSFNLKWLKPEFETPTGDIIIKVLFGSATPEQGAKELIQEFKAAADTLKNK